MLKRLLLALFALLFFPLNINLTSGQDKTNIAESVFKNATLLINPKTKSPSNIRLKEGSYIPFNSFFDEYRKTFGLSEENEIKSYRVSTDKLGQIHHRYKQFYNGIELAEVQFIIHEKNGLVFHANGNLVHGLELDVTPLLSESEALQYALDAINAETYMWQSKKNEAWVRKEQGDPNTTMYPKGILMISAKDFNLKQGNFHLVYRFDIYSEKPIDRYYVDVDAKTGEIINKISRMQSGDVQAQGTSFYNGTVSFMAADTAITILTQSKWHIDSWNAYQGFSWWVADPGLGNQGGYDNVWYEVLDTDPILLSGSDPVLNFYHRYKVENPGGEPAGYNGWDGMNVRISTNNGNTWQVLQNPVPAYTKTSLYSFGEEHGEGEGIPGWAGELNTWTNVTFNLSAYTGQTVKIRFAFASDPGSSTNDGGPDLFGWQVDNISVTSSSGTLFTNNGEANGMTGVNLVKEVSFIEGKYRLRQYSRGGGIATYNALNNTHYSTSVDFIDPDLSFDANDGVAGVSVHWGLEKTYDYYLSKLNRNSFDDNGSKIIAYARYDDQWFNAQWDGARMRFGDGPGNNSPVASIDIVAHEFTHGVTQYTANLIYQNESGALNESFSDIFGTGVEFFALGSAANWFVGEGPVRLRSMSNPKQYGQPHTYLKQGWYTGTDDNGGVHTNSGVQNMWFYLLCEGGSGVNDNGNSYSITALGIDQATQIAYRNLANYLIPTSGYSDARLGSIYAATDLYGENSLQLQSVIDAWNAVGVLKPSFVPTVGVLFDTLSFTAEVLTTTDTTEITIENYGLQVLEISDIQITGSDFQLLSAPSLPQSLDYEEEITISIIFTPSQKGERAGYLSVASNDPANPTKTIILKGTGYIISPALDGQIYALTTHANSLFITLNQNNGAGTQIGSVGIRAYSAALQPSTGLIFASVLGANAASLLKIDSETGKGYHVTGIPAPGIRPIAFDVNGDFYAAAYTGELYNVNLQTGTPTLIGSTGINTLSGLAINPLDGQLWGIAMNDMLYKIDKNNAQAAFVGQTGFPQTPAIGFDSEGKLFGSSGYSLGTKSQLILIDQNTGAGTLIGSTEFNLLTGLIITGAVTVSAEEKYENQLPAAFSLSQNYPNPFNPETKIKFTLPDVGTRHTVSLRIYNILGREVASLINEEKPAGTYEITFSTAGGSVSGGDAASLSSGVYFYKLTATSGAGNFVETRKMILLR